MNDASDGASSRLMAAGAALLVAFAAGLTLLSVGFEYGRSPSPVFTVAFVGMAL